MEAYGTTIFCDDIRQEIGGKFTLVGCYGTVVNIVTTPPVTLPKLCCAVRIMISHDYPLPDEGRLVVYLPGDPEDKPSVEDVLVFDFPDPPEDQERPYLDSVWFRILQRNLVISPFEITEAGPVRVRLIVGDNRLKLGAVQINFLDEKPKA